VRHHLLTRAVFTAGLAVAVAATAAMTTTASPAAAAIPAATTAAARADQAARPVFLVTGELISTGPGGAAGVSIRTGGPGQDAGPAGPLLTLTLGGTTYVMPVMAAPYLGRGLDPGLFQPTALARAEQGGRLPVRVAYSGPAPALPGVTITSSGGGAAVGYLTAAGARRFGAALARQYRSDHDRGSYGLDGLFGGGVGIALAGAPGPAPVPGPAFPMDTLTVSATNLRGRPDTGDFVIVGNVDDPARFSGLEGRNFFYRGTARFSVPAGHYWAVGVFTSGRSERLVVLPQFTVGGATTVHLAERSASSKVAFTTPRPAALRAALFALFRGASNGDLFIVSWLGGGINGISLWVSPATSKPTVGTLQSTTAGQLTSPRGAPGTPYAYNLGYAGPPGIIPAQHFDVSPASLATVREHYYQDVASTGSWCTIGGALASGGAFDFGCLYLPVRLPGTQTQYLSTGPNVIWQTSYGESPTSNAGGQSDDLRSFRAGQQATQDWNAYPLHPQPGTQVLHGSLAALFPSFPSAFRAGDTLTLDTTPFSDNYPGHAGTGFSTGPGAKVSGSYAIYQNGILIAHGNPAHGITPVRVIATPAVISFTLTASRQGPAFPLSPASTTTWIWHTERQPAATVSPSWACGLASTGYQRRCAVQPMMTLTYQVAGLALNGTTAPGPQTITLTASHLPLAKAAPVTSAAATVSFTGGQTWHPATVTAVSGGRFRITFNAPAGAEVTLQVHATDAAGGSVTETISNAYQVAARPANGAGR
jgi:hypothetical protein